MGIKKYKSVPIEVEAIQFKDNAATITEISNWGGSEIHIDYSEKHKVKLTIEARGEKMVAQVLDYIVKGVNGEFYACCPEDFLENFKRVKK